VGSVALKDISGGTQVKVLGVWAWSVRGQGLREKERERDRK